MKGSTQQQRDDSAHKIFLNKKNRPYSSNIMPSITFRSYSMANPTWLHHRRYHGDHALNRSMIRSGDSSSECSTEDVASLAKETLAHHVPSSANCRPVRRVHFQEECNVYHADHDCSAESRRQLWYSKEEYDAFQILACADFQRMTQNPILMACIAKLIRDFKAYEKVTSLQDIQDIRKNHDNEFPAEALGFENMILFSAFPKFIDATRRQLHRQVKYWSHAPDSDNDHLRLVSCRVSQHGKLWAQHMAAQIALQQ